VVVGSGTANWVPSLVAGVTQTNEVAGAVALDTDFGVHGNAILSTYAFSPDGDWQGLVGRYRDSCNYYVFEISEWVATARLRRVRNCSSTTLDWTLVPLFNWGLGHLVSLVFTDNSIYGFLDNVIVVGDVDNSHDANTAGYPGLWNYNQENAFYYNFELLQ